MTYIAFFGFFSFVWFGWAQENPRESWRKYLGIAAGIALITCLFGVYLSVKNWHEGTVLADFNVYKNYLIVFYTEFFIAGVGAFLFIKFKKNSFVAPWILFIVGLHFFWLKSIFDDFSLYILAILLIGISFLSLTISKKLNVAPSAITGIGAGTVLFCFAILGLIRFLLV